MQVAIAQMGHVEKADAGVQRAGARLDALQQLLHQVGPHRHVIIHEGQLQQRQFRRRLATGPHFGPLCLVLRHHGIEHRARLQRFHQRLFQLRSDRNRSIGAGGAVSRGDSAQFDQHVHLVACVEGGAGLGVTGQVGIDIGPGHVFEGLDCTSGFGLQRVKQRHGVTHRFRGHHRGRVGARLGEELDDGGGDDPERALRPDHQVAQVIAGIVLMQRAHQVHDLARGRHHLDPKAERARIAIAQHVRAARIGRQRPSQHRRAARAEE